jgi:hypothetical protein
MQGFGIWYGCEAKNTDPGNQWETPERLPCCAGYRPAHYRVVYFAGYVFCFSCVASQTPKQGLEYASAI